MRKTSSEVALLRPAEVSLSDIVRNVRRTPRLTQNAWTGCQYGLGWASDSTYKLCVVEAGLKRAVLDPPHTSCPVLCSSMPDVWALIQAVHSGYMTFLHGLYHLYCGEKLVSHERTPLREPFCPCCPSVYQSREPIPERIRLGLSREKTPESAFHTL